MKRFRLVGIGSGVAALVTAAAPVRAQTFVELVAGATYQSRLARDSIVQVIETGLAIAPSARVAVGTPLDARHSVSVEVGWARSSLQRREAGATYTLLPVTTWTFDIALHRHVAAAWTARLDVGGIKYAPASEGRDATIFRNDAPLLPRVGLGLRWMHTLGGAVAVGVDLTYSLHLFTTSAMRDDGVSHHFPAHRITAGIALRRGRDTPTPR